MKKVLLILCSILMVHTSLQAQGAIKKLNSMNLSRYQPEPVMQKLSDSFLVDSEKVAHPIYRILIYVVVTSPTEIAFEEYGDLFCRHDHQVVGYFANKGFYFIIRTANSEYLKGLFTKTDDVRAFQYKPAAAYDTNSRFYRFDYRRRASGQFDLINDSGYISKKRRVQRNDVLYLD